jgi:hypothetical protein
MDKRWEAEEAADMRIKQIYQTRKIMASGFPRGNGIYYSGFDMNYRESHADFCERTGRSPNTGFLYIWRPPSEFKMTDDNTGQRFTIKTNGGGKWSIVEHVVYDHDDFKNEDIYHAKEFARLIVAGNYITRAVLDGEWQDCDGVVLDATISVV